MNKIIFPKQIRVKGVDFKVYEQEYQEDEFVCGEVYCFPKIYREAVPVKSSDNTKKLARVLNELALDNQFHIRWDWEQLLYGGWSIQENDGEIEVCAHAHLEGKGADLVHISFPLDGGDPVCSFRYCVGLKTYYSQFNHEW